MTLDQLAFPFLSLLSKLTAYSNPHVRIALSTVLADLAPVLGRDKTLEAIIPLYTKMLKDEVRPCVDDL